MDFENRLQTIGLLVGDDTMLDAFHAEYEAALGALNAMRKPGCDARQVFVWRFRLKNLLLAQMLWSRMELERLAAN